ncbi:MAG: thiol-disulfide isomerase [Acidobacteria bacterium]|nr:thiol-disulfide isomerase [Acidobacteriota bacterium]
MSLISYKDARPHAKSIRQAVLTRQMPPWFADAKHGKFMNDRTMTQAEIDTLVAWADSGAAEGNPAEAPKPVQFVQGWNIGTPDLVAEIPRPYSVPASGTIDYTYFVLPLNLKEDTWIQAAEIRPGNREVVHHVIAFIRPPDSKWLRKASYGEPYLPKQGDGGTNFSQWVAAYAPGMPPDEMNPGQGKLVKAGSDVVFQMHYTASGKQALDQTRIGLRFAKGTPAEKVMMLAAADEKFSIPPGAPNHLVEASITLKEPTKLVSLLPHMHLRGKAFTISAQYPSGESETLLNVPRYDFAWQLIYRLEDQKALPAGTKIACKAWFDNSPNNKANPDATAAVRFGEQSWEEMMIGFFEVAVAPDVTAADIVRGRKKPAAN